MSVNQQVERLKTARETAQHKATEKSRLEGERKTLLKRKAELEERSETEFECSVDKLPSLISDMEIAAEQSLQDAEVILGLREGEVKGEPESTPAPEKAPEPKSAPQPISIPEEDEDTDGLMV